MPLSLSLFSISVIGSHNKRTGRSVLESTWEIKRKRQAHTSRSRNRGKKDPAKSKLRDLVTILSMLSTYNKPPARVMRENERCSKNSLFPFFDIDTKKTV